MNYITSAVRLMDICESELLFDTLPIAKTQRDYVKRVWMKHSVVEKDVIGKYNRIEYLVNGKRHRTDGKPAVIEFTGHKRWVVNGKSHRVDGPASVYPDGDKFWIINGKSHRVGGPTVVFKNSGIQWWVNCKLHRVDGPARMYADGNKIWCINNQQVDEF